MSVRASGAGSSFRRVAGRARAIALQPVLDRIAALDQSTASRLDELTKRVVELETLVTGIEGRTATVSERAWSQEEASIRLSRRVDEIEKLLSER